MFVNKVGKNIIMPHHKKSHDDNRQEICIFCWIKPPGKANSLRPMSDNLKEKFACYVYFKFFENQDFMPTTVCKGCYNKLSYIGTENARSMPKELPDYEKLVEEIKKSLGHKMKRRSQEGEDCSCYICQIASHYPGKGAAAPNPLIPQKPTVGRPEESTPPPRRLLDNLPRKDRFKALREGISPKMMEQLSAFQVANKMKDAIAQGASSIQMKTIVGPALHLPVPGKAKDVFNVSQELLNKLRLDLSLSGRKTQKAKALLKQFGAQTEKHLDKAIFKSNHILDNFFDVYEMEFQCKEVYANEEGASAGDEGASDGKNSRFCIVCTDVPKFIEFLQEKRGLVDQDVVLQLGIDGGGDFLKVGLIIKPREDEEDDVVRSPPKKKTHKDSGVKRLFVLFMGQDIPENYFNISQILDILDLETLNFALACDLKLLNIILGLQSHSSKHGCSWCDVITRGEDQYVEQGQPRTFGEIKMLAQEFEANGSKQAMAFKNCVKPPLLKADPDAAVVEVVCPPELHLFTGTTNVILDGLQDKTVEKVKAGQMAKDAYQFLESANIQREPYFGKKLNGPNCKKLITKPVIDNLLAFLPDDLKPWALCLKILDDLTKACFGKKLSPHWIFVLDSFEKAYNELDLKLIPKTHALFVHVREFCLYSQQPLGIYSEQSFEGNLILKTINSCP